MVGVLGWLNFGVGWILGWVGFQGELDFGVGWILVWTGFQGLLDFGVGWISGWVGFWCGLDFGLGWISGWVGFCGGLDFGVGWISAWVGFRAGLDFEVTNYSFVPLSHFKNAICYKILSLCCIWRSSPGQMSYCWMFSHMKSHILIFLFAIHCSESVEEKIEEKSE